MVLLQGGGGELLLIHSLKYNSNMVVEGGTVSHYYILVNRKFIYFMSLFRHSVWFSFSVKQFPSADFGICNICSSVETDFYGFSLYSFHNFSLRFIKAKENCQQHYLSEFTVNEFFNSFGFQKMYCRQGMNATRFFFLFFCLFFCESDDLQLYCQHITDTTPYSCGRRKFSLACSHAQRPRNYHANTCTKVNEREGGLLTKLWL